MDRIVDDNYTGSEFWSWKRMFKDSNEPGGGKVFLAQMLYVLWGTMEV
jgi:hypothetical protein